MLWRGAISLSAQLVDGVGSGDGEGDRFHFCTQTSPSEEPSQPGSARSLIAQAGHGGMTPAAAVTTKPRAHSPLHEHGLPMRVVTPRETSVPPC